MSSASIYDWEKSLQSSSFAQFTFSPSPNLPKNKSKGTIDYFLNEEKEENPSASSKAAVEDLNEIGDIIFRKIVETWKMKNLE